MKTVTQDRLRRVLLELDNQSIVNRIIGNANIEFFLNRHNFEFIILIFCFFIKS